jgi:hypothetical protein
VGESGESGESVAANPSAPGRGFAPATPLKTETKKLSKKKEQEAFCAHPLVGNRAGRVVGRFQVITEGTPVGSQLPPAKWPVEREAAQTLKSQIGSAGLQNAAFNMLRATWNPLKQCGLPTFPMRFPMRPENRRHPQILLRRRIVEVFLFTIFDLRI